MSELKPGFDLLMSSRPHDGADPRIMQFGSLVGSWLLDVTFYETDGSSDATTAEWHWSWILGGRAIQDLLIFPAQTQHESHADYRYGTSLRVFDEASEIWKVVWVAPQSGTIYKLSGIFDNDGVVLNGDPHDGEPTKWTFSDMSNERFLWEGSVKEEPGSGWRLIQQMEARRTA